MEQDKFAMTLQQYRNQRQYREERRKEFMRRFHLLKQKMNFYEEPQTEISKPQPIKITQKVQNTQKTQKVVQASPKKEQIKNEDKQLLKQNQQLRQQLITLQGEERDRLGKFKDEITSIKQKYLSEIMKLTEVAKNNKEKNQQKMEKLLTQIANATDKNKEIQTVNETLEKQLANGDELIGKYSEDIKKQYSDKLEEFEKIFSSSSEKIEALEKEFNEDQFIENTLKNQELVKTIIETSEKSQQTAAMVKDYQTLLDGKNQILVEIIKNNQMKEKELSKMSELEEKLKTISDKLTQQKQVYIAENNQLAKQLMEIKNLLTSSLPAELMGK